MLGSGLKLWRDERRGRCKLIPLFLHEMSLHLMLPTLVAGAYLHCLPLPPPPSLSPSLSLSLSLPLSLSSPQSMWIPGSQTEMVVVTDSFVKIYDMRVDLLCPVYYFIVLTGKIKDATVAVTDEVCVCVCVCV